MTTEPLPTPAPQDPAPADPDPTPADPAPAPADPPADLGASTSVPS